MPETLHGIHQRIVKLGKPWYGIGESLTCPECGGRHLQRVRMIANVKVENGHPIHPVREIMIRCGTCGQVFYPLIDGSAPEPIAEEDLP